jgi:hypothetical protein
MVAAWNNDSSSKWQGAKLSSTVSALRSSTSLAAKKGARLPVTLSSFLGVRHLVLMRVIRERNALVMTLKSQSLSSFAPRTCVISLLRSDDHPINWDQAQASKNEARTIPEKASWSLSE